jgi:AcrR family transcriptional regulator
MPPDIKEAIPPFSMSLENQKPRRKLRADSLRNRERLLQAAADIFSGTDGPQASLEAVARKAGVGIGTFYRHFPTREALFEAVYRQEVDHLGDLAVSLVENNEPVEALRKWLQANVRVVAGKKGMAQALQLAAPGSSELKAYSSARMIGALQLLIGRAVTADKIRADVPPEDLLRALVGIFYSQGSADWQPMALRLVDVLVDGLRKC